MMTVRLRLLSILARWWLRERRLPCENVSRLPLRCVVTDCDINRHMNNSRYLALMDLGRYHLVLRSGLWRELLGRKWYPVAASITIDYKKALKPGDRFVLETQQARVGKKSAVLSQKFWVGDVLYAEAEVVVVFLHRGRPVELAGIAEIMPHVAPVGDPRLEN